MNFKTYINYLENGAIHAGIYIDDFVIYIREVEPFTVQPLKGYIEVRLDEDTERSWDAIEAVVSEGLAQIGTFHEAKIYYADTSKGTLGFSARPGVPQTVEDIIRALRDVFEQITSEGTVKKIPQNI